MRCSALLAVILATGVSLAVPAAAADDGQGRSLSSTDPGGTNLKIELNRMENVGEGCKTYLLLDNRGPALKSLKVALYALDTEGIVQKSLAVELGPIQEKKIKVRPFDFPGLACPKIGKVLLNDVLNCEGTDSGSDNCLDRIATSSKANVEFVR